jgi:parallel beta-helix repeat protein
VNITNNYVEGDGNTTALEYTGTSGPVIERFDLKDNTFDNFGTGIEISYVNNGNINGNSIHVSDDGIVLDNCNDCFVTGNRCEFEYSNKTGIVVTNSTEVHVQNNFLKNFNTAVSGATTETDNVLI